MAKFAISEEGVSQLRKLSQNIIKGTEEIYESGVTLKQFIYANGDRLGIYEDKIATLVDHNQSELRLNRDDFKKLSDSIIKKADEICDLMGFDNAGSGYMSDRSTYTAFRSNSHSENTYSTVDLKGLSEELYSMYSSKYGNYISRDKLDNQLDNVRFISQSEMDRRTKTSGVLGYNNGKVSVIAEGTGHELPTIVHENLHQLSNNNGKAGIVVKSSYNYSRNVQMNEAITELLTKRTLGERYGKDYSLYSDNRDAMTILESAIGKDLIAEAYFQNKPELIEQKIESVLGYGSWEQLSEAFDDCVSDYEYTREMGKIRRDSLIDRFMRSSSFVKGGDDEWIELLM